jgi:tripartite-type tricarboxylate transporter receptor subunit TctC
MKYGKFISALGAAMLAVCAAGISSMAQAETFPNQPVKIIVPFAPGGGNDILARAIAPHMSKVLGQPVIVDNRPGAGGNLGTDIAARATDGHTIVIASNQITINPALNNKTPFDIQRDFAPIGVIASVPIVLVVGPQQPYKTLPEFLKYVKANPGKVSYSSPGLGTPQHLAGELFAYLNKTKMLHGPYKGTSPAITDVIAGQVESSFGTMASVQTYVQADKLRALGIAGKKRTPGFPNLPTFEELGMKDYDAELWYCLLAPASMPPANVAKLNAALSEAMKTLQANGAITKLGFEPAFSSQAELKEKIAKDLTRWSRLVKETGVKVE